MAVSGVSEVDSTSADRDDDDDHSDSTRGTALSCGRPACRRRRRSPLATAMVSFLCTSNASSWELSLRTHL